MTGKTNKPGVDVPQQYLLAVAYQPGPDPLIKKGQDGHRDYFTPAELEKAAWSLLGRDVAPDVGVFHVDGTTGHARVVESYIHRGPDWIIKAVDGTEQVIKAGTWLVGLQCDDVAWDLYKSGRVSGVSVQGTATRRRKVSP